MHSIERVKIEIQFAEPLPSKIIAKLGDGFDQRRGDFHFGARIEHHMPTIVPFDNPQMPAIAGNTIIGGWQFLREDSPGIAVEALVLAPKGLAHETNQYTRWVQFFDRFESMASTMVAAILENIRVKNIVLEYADRFLFEPNVIDKPTLPAPGTLLKKDLTLVLGNEARNGTEPWHLYRGWFEGADPNRYLVNQNIDTQYVVDVNNQVDAGGSETQIPSVRIFTKIEQRNPDPNLDFSMLKINLNEMHDISKKVVQDALLEDMSRKIGLTQ